MSEHNFHEIAPAAVAGIVAKGAKVLGAAKGAGKVAKKAAGLISTGSEEAETTSDRVNEEQYILSVFTNHLLENNIADSYYNACVLMEVLSDEVLLSIVEKESEAFGQLLSENTATLKKPSTTSGAKNKIVQTGRNAAKNAIKPSNLKRPIPSAKPSLNPVSAAAQVIGADIMKGRTAAAKETKPGEKGSMDWAGGDKKGFRSSGQGFRRWEPGQKPKEPKIAPQPKTTPTPPKPSPTKPQPKVEPTPQKEPQKDPKPDTDNPGEKTPKKPPVKTPTTTDNDTKKNQRGSSMKNRTDSGSATNIGNKIKNAATGLAKGVGTAAAVGTLAAMKGKLPKPNLDTGGKIGKTKDRVSYKKQSEELEVVCDYLLDNGFADTGVQAETMYEHMTEEWKTHILNS